VLILTKERKKTNIEDLKGSLKYEIAEELGLLDKVEKYGWGSLTAEETGRIGGYMAHRKRKKREKLTRP